MAILTIEHASKIYGTGVQVRAVNDLSMKMEEGEFVAIMGASGSGKSTLLNLISGILPLSSGEIRIDGRDISHLGEPEAAEFRRNELGFVFQDFNLVDTLTIRENIMLPLMLRHVPPARMNAAAESIAASLGIGKILDKRTHEVSGGQAQRAAIARAIIHSPRLLLADEPTGNLDSAAAEGVMRIFADLNARRGTSTIIVTHDAKTASFCTRAIFIKDGCILEELYREGDGLAFYDEILNVLKFMGAK
ncbi:MULTISPECIES: ABC transporter ATP-binding protein [Olsenella]|uniref:ABC transporter ATP-binding protein n=1 Tax=Olsenella TaxID=133925 RepID=UPI000231EE33|nr:MULTISPECIES: ABC transporter ATP-binding protein [Olsenella]EHF01669.1 hypothetical protein HMPREF1008_01293 [Olsenella sp. oral taxon 809 str. F0356]